MKVTLFYADIEKTMFQESIAEKVLKDKGLGFAWEKIKSFPTLKHAFKGSESEVNLQICEWFFERTNTGSILSGEDDQKLIGQTKAHHTSMSVSDIVQIDNKFYMCASAGFKEITSLVKEVIQN